MIFALMFATGIIYGLWNVRQFLAERRRQNEVVK